MVKVEKLPRLTDAPANDEQSNSGDELQQQSSARRRGSQSTNVLHPF